MIPGRNLRLWTIAFTIFAFSAVYQRLTGPTHPMQGTVELGSEIITYKLPRSHGGPTDCPIGIEAPAPSVSGTLSYKRFPTTDPWVELSLKREGDKLIGFLPHQLPAGKLLYRTNLRSGRQMAMVPPGKPVVIRFKGAVPLGVLIAHAFFMALAMILSNRAGLEALTRRGETRKLTCWTIGTLLLGGLIFGPIVQKYAFGELWTGVPCGFDMTDNKTILAFVFWLIAFIALRRNHRSRAWVLLAAAVMLAVYFIPHSLLGSELDYSKM